MSLYAELQKVQSEEDVKDVYIKYLGLKKYTKGLIDIQTDEIWFEAKHTGRDSLYTMFTQLLHYVQVALNNGETVPPLLAVIDTEKAALMKSVDVLPFLAKKTVKWGKSASKPTSEAIAKISAHIGAHFVSFKIETHEEEFLSTTKAAIKSGDIIRIQITPDNIKQVFDKWVDMIGYEISGVAEEDYALLFFADVMHDGTISTHNNLPAELLYKNNAPVFSLDGRLYELDSTDGYRRFWAIYDRPPREEYRDYLLERRDSLIPIDERAFKGAFYTPLEVVDKAYDLLAEALGKNWQKDYIVWDMCCGVGNLEVKHSNPRNIYMSTLDEADVDVMKATKTCVAAQRFQYDYLNDDITDDGRIDYSLTEKVPAGLRKAIADGKRILVLINPPYAEATSSDSARAGDDKKVKAGVAKTKFASKAMMPYGKATNELFMQFVARVAQEMPTATLAMFSKLKYVNAPTLKKFRQNWNAKYIGGFAVHSKAFDGLSGNFPIGFLVWRTNQGAKKKTPIGEISVEMLDKNAQPIGEKKFYNAPEEGLLTDWVDRPPSNNVDVVPLKNAVIPAVVKKDLRGKKWSDGAIGWLNCAGNDLQQAAQLTFLLSSGFGSGRGFFVTPNNLWQAAVIFAVRRLIKPTWQNDRDQFYQPVLPLSDEFKNDCLVWMLFNNSNLTASANELEWNGKTWEIVNHFIPFSEAEVGAPSRFESEFMVQYLDDKMMSEEAKSVLKSGRDLWRSYFSQKDMRKVREQLKLNRPDVGWYQVRSALKARNDSGDTVPVSFDDFEVAYQILSEKLHPQVYELGFLR